MRRTRILVADASPLFRTGVQNLLKRESDLLVLEAKDCAGAEAFLDGGSVDIALIDLELPPRGGIDVVTRMRGRSSADMIVWSLEPSREAVLASITAGAHGFLHKGISSGALVRALRGVVNGVTSLPSDMASLMIDAIHAHEERSKTLELAAVLSQREREVLAWVARGARNFEIAEQLAISEFTVKRHMQNILHKLELPSRGAAAAFYLSAFRGGDLGGGVAR